MADNKKNNGGDMSVDELVSRLRDNISSSELPQDDSANVSSKTISKKVDPDKDIASMLKKFMPEEGDGADDFELDEMASDSESDDSDFELVADHEYDVDIPQSDRLAADDFDFDDESADIFGAEFDEPSEEIMEDFIPEEEDVIVDAVSFDAEPRKKEEKKKHGGLFGLGRKKGSSLADGYAKMLELELDADNSEADKATEEFEQLSFDTEISEENTEAEEPEAITYDELMASDMPELDSLNNADEKEPDIQQASSVAEESSSEEVFSDESEAMLSQMFEFENSKTESEPEEEYFVPVKKPLAFDDEDETPIVPDESAFTDIGPSDVSAFTGESEHSEVDAAEEADASESTIEELDDKDINLMIALGYEDELEKAIGKDTVDEISENLNAEIVDFIDIDSAYAFDGIELNSPDRFRVVGNRYKQEHATMKMRLLGTSIFAFALLLFELLGMFGVTLGGALNISHYPVVGIMLSLQLLVLACALSWRQIFIGLYDAITFNPSPSSIPSAAVLMTVIYDIIMALAAPNSGLMLYNFPAALCLVFLVLNDYFNLSREIRSFNTIATRRPKYAVSLINNEIERSAEEEMMAIFSDEEQHHSYEKVLQTQKVGFIDNYFHRTNIRSIKSRNRCLLIFPFIALAIALGVVSFVTNRSGITAFNISILTVLFCMPMSALFIYSYPFFGAVNTAFEKDATIIGEESLEEYSDASTVIFSDKDVFPVESTVTKGIKLYDNNAIYYVLYHLTSLYSKIGGPLKERLVQATTELGHSEDVEIIRIAQKGVEAVVDGKVHVLAGQASFMEENGIAVGIDPDDDRMMAEGASALYLVLDGVLSAKLYVSYGIDPEFENVISSLAEERMETVIRTCDPNIDEQLLESRLRVSKFPARIIKGISENNGEVESANSGIVSRNSLTALARAISLCNKIRRVRKTAKSVSVASMVVSVVMMIFLSLFSSELEVPSVYVALYQIFWMLPMVLFTKLYVK